MARHLYREVRTRYYTCILRLATRLHVWMAYTTPELSKWHLWLLARVRHGRLYRAPMKRMSIHLVILSTHVLGQLPVRPFPLSSTSGVQSIYTSFSMSHRGAMVAGELECSLRINRFSDSTHFLSGQTPSLHHDV
jgi:hypothetical protein